MITVVVLLIVAASGAWIGGVVATFMFHQALKRHGLPVPDYEADRSWMWASYPPDVHRARLWNFVCIVLFLVCITALALTAAFDLCPGCVTK